MRIKLITLMSGPDGSFEPGTELEVDPKRGRALVDGNFATEVKPVRSRRGETAMLKAPENTALTPAEQDASAHLVRIAEAEGAAQGGVAPPPETGPQGSDEATGTEQAALGGVAPPPETGAQGADEATGTEQAAGEGVADPAPPADLLAGADVCTGNPPAAE